MDKVGLWFLWGFCGDYSASEMYSIIDIETSWHIHGVIVHCTLAYEQDVYFMYKDISRENHFLLVKFRIRSASKFVNFEIEFSESL